MNRLGNYLNQLREIKGVSFREVSKKTGISHTYLSNLEKGYDPRSGKEISPSPHTIRKLSNYYNKPYVDLLNIAGYITLEDIHEVFRKSDKDEQR